MENWVNSQCAATTCLSVLADVFNYMGATQQLTKCQLNLMKPYNTPHGERGMPTEITLRAVTRLIFELQTSRSVQIDQNGALVQPVAMRVSGSGRVRFGTRPGYDLSI